MIFSNVYKIARKEIIHNFYNYWFFLSAFIFCFINFLILYFGDIISGDYSQTDIRSLVLSVIHLQMYLISLFSFILSYDSILSEKETGVLDLILSYRFTFFEIIIGKLVGNSLIFSLSFIFGFIPIMIYLVFFGIKLIVLFKFIFVSIWLNFVFNSFSLCISSYSKDRTIVIFLSIFIWIFFIFIYDLLFTLIAIVFHGDISSDLISFLLFLNPIEIFRLISIIFFMPFEANDLFGVNVGALKLYYILISMFIWFSLSFFFIFLATNNKN